ncbi:MAG: hypothetical protein H6741_00180 [Alphaproteobacteria bacterium]|nr:hypothetical protein [Alphaproteobacteria bacterium]MCB9791121.1 hypothetical protein [Alphaproteobacteria bacterium]
MTTHPIRLQRPGLLTLLGRQLQAEPERCLRELIRLAQGAIERRRALAEARGEPPPVGRIDVLLAANGDHLTVSDDGCGLTEAEAHAALGTLGPASADEPEDDGPETRLDDAGLALLCAFQVADRVVIESRAPGAPPIRWSCRGDSTYDLAPGTREALGTRVTLHLRDDARVDGEGLGAQVRRYADFIGVPVHVQGAAAPVNTVHAPWRRDDLTGPERADAARQAWAARSPRQDDLLVIPVDEPLAWTTRARVQGVLAIPGPRPSKGLDQGTFDVIWRRQHLASGLVDLLPTWASFVHGVIACDGLTPTAARDGVVFDEATEALAEALGRCLLAALRDLAREDPARFKDALRLHARPLMAACLDRSSPEQEAFIAEVALDIPLESLRGRRSVSDALLEAGPADEAGRRVLLCLTDPGSPAQRLALRRPPGADAFTCTDPLTERFLALCAARWPDRMRLQRVDLSDAEALLEPLSKADAVRARRLEAAFRQAVDDPDCTLQVRCFPDPTLPALRYEPPRTRTHRHLKAVFSDLSTPLYLRRAVQGLHLQRRPPPTLYLNASNPGVQALLQRRRLTDDVTVGALTALYDYAWRLDDPDLGVWDLKQAAARLERILGLLLRLDSPPDADP